MAEGSPPAAPPRHPGSGEHPGPRPDVSIVLVTLNRFDLLTACLSSLEAMPDAVSWEAIVIDNGSTRDVVGPLRERHPYVRVVRNEENTGYAHANNQGLALARGRFLLLLNDDTEVRPYALERLVRFLEERPGVGACAPALFYPDGRPQRSLLGFPTPWGLLCNMLFLRRLFPGIRLFTYQDYPFDYRRTARVEQPIGAALMVRREVYEEIGPLDERFRIHFNDVDWCYRIHRAGWEIYFVAEAEVVHHQGITIRDPARWRTLQPVILQSMFAYYEKHYGRTGLLWMRAWMLVGYGIRRVAMRVLNRLRPTEQGRTMEGVYRAMFRIARNGDPLSYAPEA